MRGFVFWNHSKAALYQVSPVDEISFVSLPNVFI